MSELFIKQPELLKQVLITEEKNKKLLSFLSYVLDLNFMQIRINPKIEKIENYEGISSEKDFYVIVSEAKLLDGRTLPIGFLTIPENRIFQNIFIYWTYYYENYIYPKNPEFQEMIMNQIEMQKEDTEEGHEIIYLGMESKNPNKLENELEFHSIHPSIFLEKHKLEFFNLYQYLPNFENQNLLIVPHFEN